MTPSASPISAMTVRRSPWDRALMYTVLAALVIAMAVWNAQKARDMVTRLDFGDFRVFHRTAEAFIAGDNMYARTRHTVEVGGQSVSFDRPNLNPPHFHLLLLPLARLPL